MLAWQIENKRPDYVVIAGNFGPSVAASLDIGVPATNFDTVIEAGDSAGATVYGESGNDITLTTVADAAYADAEADAGAVNTKLDTVFDLSGGTLGAAGNDWIVRPVSAFTGGSGTGVHIMDDTANKIVYVLYEEGVSTVTNVETAIGAYGGNAAVKTGGTGANILAAATDQVDVPFSGGADQETIEVSGNAITIHFEDGVTTVTEAEALITALAGADKIIKIKTAGTGVNVLAAPADVFAGEALTGGVLAETNKVGKHYTVARTGTGAYTITFADYMPSVISKRCSLQLNSAGDQEVMFGAFSQANKTQIAYIWDNSDGAVADLAHHANNRIHFEVKFQR